MKFDYISILAGGKCPFKCSFCIGNNIRENKKPHFSTKWKAFIECFADMTNLLSISGDTSDPSFIKETWEIPKIAKQYNSNIKVTLHTRNIKVIEKAIESNYDSFVLSIDEEVDKKTIKKLKDFKNKIDIRLSIVIISDNFCILEKWSEELKEIFDFKMTIRPEVNEAQDEVWAWGFYNAFLNIRSKKYKSPYNSNKYVIKMKNGAFKLKRFPNIWFWDYNKTNPNLNVRYLFSNGEIGSNCRWNKIHKELKWTF